jgi:hypothetical protein
MLALGCSSTDNHPSHDGGDCACDSATDGIDAIDGSADPSSIRAPRLIAPLSTATVTSQRPTLRWALADGTDAVQIDICRDRACSTPVTSFTAEGTSGAPTVALPAGVSFWRAFGRSAGVIGQTPSATWELTVGARSAPFDSSSGTIADVNGDGHADLLVGATERAYVYLGSTAGVAPSPDDALTDPGLAPSTFGAELASAGDVNGDGYADVLVGAPNPSLGSSRVHVYFGGATALTTPPAVSLTDPLEPNPPLGETSLFGIAVASAGDVNGDGYADILVGEPEIVRGTGKAYLYLGGPTGPSAEADIVFVGPDGASGHFGHSVAGAGDLNGDGYADILIAAVGYASQTGRVYVYLGGPTGPATQADLTLTGPDGAGGYFGRPAISAGDVNGDGYADVIITAYGIDANTGRAYLYLGGPTGLATMPAVVLAGPDGAGGNFGYAVAGAGDVDGDGYGDIVVGADGAGGNTGRVYLYLGNPTGLASQAAATVIGPDGMGGHFGRFVAAAGDIDGDGHADIAVGADDVDNMAGRAYLLFGRSSGLGTAPDVTLTDPQGAGYFGLSVL